MPNLKPTPSLGSYSQTWGGLTLTENEHTELVSLTSIQNEETKFAKAFETNFNAKPPQPNTFENFENGMAFWTSSGQCWVMAQGKNPNLDKDLGSKMEGSAYAVLLTDGWTSLTLIGAQSYDVLERFIPLDIRKAPINFASRTSAHHIAVIILKFSDTEFQLLTPRSSAQSFLEGLTHTIDNVLLKFN